MTAKIEDLGTEVMRALETIGRAVGTLRPVHVTLDLSTPGRVFAWVGRQQQNGELEHLFVGELILPVVPEANRPGVRHSSGFMPMSNPQVGLQPLKIWGRQPEGV